MALTFNFDTEQANAGKFEPMISESDLPPMYLNKEKQNKFRPALEKSYYGKTTYDSYVAQLGVAYPMLKAKE